MQINISELGKRRSEVFLMDFTLMDSVLPLGIRSCEKTWLGVYCPLHRLCTYTPFRSR